MPITLWEPARGQRVPVVVWARDANEATLRQLAELASRPFVAERVCAMADAHVASGVAVGTVFATEHAVVPRALGGDLGCGVAASRLAVEAHELDRDRIVADPDPLAALDVRDDAGRSYLDDHAWSLAFARANRDALAARAVDVIANVLGRDVDVLEHIDVHHNHVGFEVHDSHTLLVRRKGAIHVPRGSFAVVPGSMATSSCVVEGLGSPLAFDSCSHGAGRALTRTEARRRISAGSLAREMRRIAWPSHLAHRLVEEAPAAYRDLADVLDAQRDLVRRVRRLEPIAVVKG